MMKERDSVAQPAGSVQELDKIDREDEKRIPEISDARLGQKDQLMNLLCNAIL